METQTIKPKRRNSTPTPKDVPGASTGHCDGHYYVASADLKPMIEKALPRFNDEKGEGAVERITLDAATAIRTSEPLTQVAVCRRLNDIRGGRSRATNTELAESLCYAAGLEMSDLPLFPAGVQSAREMVDCHFEFNCDEEWDELERSRLARMLWKFGLGYIAATDEEPDVEEYARQVARHRLRLWAKKQGEEELAKRPEDWNLAASA